MLLFQLLFSAKIQTTMGFMSSFPTTSKLSKTATITTPTPRIHSKLEMLDPSLTTDTIMNNEMLQSSLSFLNSGPTSTLLSFSDQGQNLAGIFFQASLLPYLLFLYFLNFRGNRVPVLGNFGFQFLLLFVLSTIPSGIISKSVYGCSLADVDWLHGGAEALLTTTSLLVVLGFRGAALKETPPDPDLPRKVAFGLAGTFAVACAVGTNIFGAHTPFLFGLGDLGTGITSSFSWISHAEPINALSIPTWAIHFSSVIEWIFAMTVIWNFAEVTDNPKWKGMTWGMLPLHASGLAACTYHFFYNNPNLQFLVSLQAGLTLLGNLTLAIAAYRLAISNGWTLSELNPFPKDETSPAGIRLDELAATPLNTNTLAYSNAASETSLAIKLLGATFATAYLVKYGELALDLPFESNPNPILALLLVFAPVVITSASFANRAKAETEGSEGGLLSSVFGGNDNEGPTLSMEDIKKFGVAGTVAYVLTELAFWAVAFPVASTALYQTSGHWPDVINNVEDRATVLGFIFAGANIARLAVPLRLGAAIALAPWVDENIINRGKEENTESS